MNPEEKKGPLEVLKRPNITIIEMNQILKNINMYIPPSIESVDNFNNSWTFTGVILDDSDNESIPPAAPPKDKNSLGELFEKEMEIWSRLPRYTAFKIIPEEEENKLKFNHDETEEIRTWMRHQFSELHFLKRDWSNWTLSLLNRFDLSIYNLDWDGDNNIINLNESDLPSHYITYASNFRNLIEDNDIESDESDLPSFRSDEARIDTDSDNSD
jgi:hypothetical protein